MKKLQSHFLFKFNSSYLRDCNYKVCLTLEEARRNNQVIRQGESELVRKILRIEKSEYTPQKLQELVEIKGRLLGRKDEKDNRKILVDIEKQIDNLLFIPDLVSVKFSDSRHYKKIVEKGLKINGKNFVRLLCSAGMARSNTVLFVNKEIEEELLNFLNCGRDTSIKMNTNKFSVYISLASSAGHRVSTPIFCVVPDMVVKRTIETDYVSESPFGKDAKVERKEIEIDASIFDGQGLLDPYKAQDWAEELEAGYIPSAYICRGPFIKGLFIVSNFKRIAEENNVEEIIDIYGNKHNIFDIDAIVSLSQFKMMDGFTSIEQFREEAKKRDFGWSVSRVTPKQDKNTANTNYQYLQSLCLDEKSIPVICKDTIDWLSSVRQDGNSTLLFLLGELTKEKLDNSWFSKFSDPIVKSILLNPDCINDPHILLYIQRLVRKIETQAKFGTLRVSGNYSFLSVDPVAQAEHALGLPVKGIVKQGMIYSNFWNKKGEEEVSILRSPTTWISEIIKTKLQNDDIVNDYLRYSYSNLVFNIFDNYLLSLAGADVDGDIALSTPFLNDYVFENQVIPSYDRKTAGKEEIDFSKLWESDVRSFNSKVGLLTNIATSFFSMLCLYDENSIEYNTIINRLKISNVLQGQIIDSAKGIRILDFPKWWINKLSEEEKENLTQEEIELYDKLRIRNRPYFMRYLYEKYNKDYRKHQETYENLSQIRYGMSFLDLQLKEDKSEKEQLLITNYHKYSPLLDSPSPMNQLCHYVENEVGKIKKKLKQNIFDYTIYLDPDIELDQSKLSKMRSLYKEYSSAKRSSKDTGRKNKEEKDELVYLFRKKLYEISSNLAELTNLAVIICYKEFPKQSKEFLWKLLSSGIISNLDKNNLTRTISLPFEDENGDFEYLNKKYSFYDIEI